MDGAMINGRDKERAREREIRKERKKRGNRKYGQSELRHAKAGIYSLLVAIAAVIIFAILLLAGGLYYVFYLLFTRGRVSMPKWYFFLPSLVAIAGVVALVLPIESNPTLFLMTGVSLIALSVTSVVISYSEYVAYRAALKAAKANAEVVSVEVAEVGDNASEQ